MELECGRKSNLRGPMIVLKSGPNKAYLQTPGSSILDRVIAAAAVQEVMGQKLQ